VPFVAIPYVGILNLRNRVMLFSGVHTDYFMPELPACPRCNATVTARTLVDWSGGGVVGCRNL